MNIIKIIDDGITELKNHNIKFVNGRPQIPIEMIYNECPKMIETYQFRNELPIQLKKDTLISYYSDDKILIHRFKTIKKDAEELRDFAGIVGMDISPSINMLKPRQLENILLNDIYNCLMALNGIKIAINARIGDMKTLNLINDIPKHKTLVFGNLGSKGLFLNYSIYQFKQWLKIAKPKNICVYGTISKKDIRNIQENNIDCKIVLYPKHNLKKETQKKVFIIRSNEYTSNKNPRFGFVHEYIISHKIKKINPYTKKIFCERIETNGS